LHFFLGRGLDVGGFVDGVELAALDRVAERFLGALDALEEGVAFGFAGGGFLVRVVLEDLLAGGLLDLFVGGPVAVLGEAKDSVVVLSLSRRSVLFTEWLNLVSPSSLLRLAGA
jgi:hypothetical protein